MEVITLLNQKGGVGKTSLTHHLAGAFSKAGRRVLLVDNDPQSSLSQGLFGPDAVRGMIPAETVAALYSNEDPFIAMLIKKTDIPRVDLIAGSRTAARFNVPEPDKLPFRVQLSLEPMLSEIENQYDVVLIDCPPNLHLCSWAALMASDHLIVPLQPEDYGAQGIADVMESVDQVRARENSGLNLLGFVLTKCSFRKKIHQYYEEELRSIYGEVVLKTRIPDAVAYIEAIGRRQPVEQYQPRCAAAVAMRALAAEIMDRVEAHKTQEVC